MECHYSMGIALTISKTLLYMDQDQALALGVAVTFTLTGLCCLAWGLHNMFIRERIIVEPSEEDSTFLLAGRTI